MRMTLSEIVSLEVNEGKTKLFMLSIFCVLKQERKMFMSNKFHKINTLNVFNFKPFKMYPIRIKSTNNVDFRNYPTGITETLLYL